jgi:hypothetical protein
MTKRQVLGVGAWRCGLGGKRHKRFEFPASVRCLQRLLQLCGHVNFMVAQSTLMPLAASSSSLLVLK